MTRLPLTACMIVRNEEKYLVQCLSSLVHLVSEIVVVDTGSVDGTLDILRNFNTTIIQTTWQWNFAQARNLCLAHAQQPWILSIDADEELIAPESNYMLKLIESADVDGYFIKIKNILNTETDDFITDSACRLFRNHPRIRFSGAIHESVIPDIQALHGHMEFSDITFIHYGYTPEAITTRNKNDRNLRIIQQQLTQDPNDLTMQYALGTEYFQQEEYSKSLEILYPLLGKIPMSVGYVSDILLKTVYALRSLGRLQTALDVAAVGGQHFPDFPDLLDLHATLLIQLGDYPEAKKLLEQSVRLGDMSHKYTSASAAGRHQTYLLMAITQELLGNFSDAVAYCQLGIDQSPNYVSLWKRCTLLTLGLGWHESLRTILNQYSNELTDSVWNVVFQALLDYRDPNLTRTVMTDYYSRLDVPILNAILCAQEGNLEKAEEQFHQLMSTQEFTNIVPDYLRALKILNLHTDSEICIELNSLELAISDTEPPAIAFERRVLPFHKFRSVQRALLHVGALDAWIIFQEHFMPSEGPWLPIHLPLTLLGLPILTRKKILALADSQAVTLVLFEHALLGLIALESDEPKQALRWFQSWTKHSTVSDIVVILGTYAACVQLANAHLRDNLSHKLHLPVREILVHLLSYY